MIRLIAHTLPPPPPLPEASSFLSLPVCRRSSLLTGEGGGSEWSRSQIIRPRGSLALYNYSILSFGLTDGRGGEWVGEEPNHTTRGSLALYKLINTLWEIRTTAKKYGLLY